MVQQNALLIGNSDGIGLAMTKRLLNRGWDIIGISRSESKVENTKYHHRVVDVCDMNYPELLDELLMVSPVDLCIYFVGIGEKLNLSNMCNEPKIIDVNFTGLVKTAAQIIPQMVKRGQGHFIGISSFADELLSAEAPSYHASKGVYVTNVRFGFVDTKMAKGDVKPFIMTAEKAVDHLEYCISKRPVCYTAPKIAIPLVKFRKLMIRFGGK